MTNVTPEKEGIASLDLTIPLQFSHRIRFGRNLFESPFADVLEEIVSPCRRIVAFIEDSVAQAHPHFCTQLEKALLGRLANSPVVLPGGEKAKENFDLLHSCWNTIEAAHIDRHSAVICIGGGAFLDAIGFAAATAHRGVRLIRIPSTTLSQDDSSVGVKNGINAFGKKNFLGSFAVPYAVLIDFHLLSSQPEASRRAGYIEAIKVALVKDASFFDWLEINAAKLARLDEATEEELIRRSAILHARHIAEGGDPFEFGSSRPLDYGHWAAHKLEQMTQFELSHGEAVAIGVSLDTLYSSKIGLLSPEAAQRVLQLIITLKLPIWHQALEQQQPNGSATVFTGLEEFREHLGGQLTVLLLESIGKGVDTHEFDYTILTNCLHELASRHQALPTLDSSV